MTKRLKKVKIAGHWYRIKWVKGLYRDHDTAGMSNANKLTIELDPTGKRSHQMEVFIHEVVEQLNYRYELNLPHNTISALGAGIFQVLNDNPGILEGID